MASQGSSEEIRRELEALREQGSGDSGGKRIRREDIYEERLGRARVR